MEQYDYQHHFGLGHPAVTVITALLDITDTVFFHLGAKKLAELKIDVVKSSAIQNNSVTLSSVSIAIIVCISL